MENGTLNEIKDRKHFYLHFFTIAHLLHPSDIQYIHIYKMYVCYLTQTIPNDCASVLQMWACISLAHTFVFIIFLLFVYKYFFLLYWIIIFRFSLLRYVYWKQSTNFKNPEKILKVIIIIYFKAFFNNTIKANNLSPYPF